MLNITIDGPVGAGKSSVADDVAKKLEILHLDTGAMYRAFAYRAIQLGINFEDTEKLKQLATNINISVEFVNNKQITNIDGKSVDEFIRTPQVSMGASTISKLLFVREKLVSMQREIAKKFDMVLDGRDTGSNVLKEAPVKIYLTASAEKRAERRYLQQKAIGNKQEYEQVLKDVIKRDNQDMTREINPLKKADDAIVLDTSEISQEQTVEEIIKIVRKKYGK